MCVYESVFVCLLSWLVELFVVSVDGDTTMVGDGPWHRGHPRDDSRGWVITQDVI